MNTGLVSVIVPSYNQGSYLPGTIASIAAQTYTNWECIIVNDGSSDNTEEVAGKLVANDQRIQYIAKKNGGSSSARKAGCAMAKGEFFLFLDGDDLIKPQKLQKSVEIFQANAQCDIVATNFEMCNSNETEIYPPFCILKKEHFTYKQVLLEWDRSFAFPPHSCIYRSKLFTGYPFNENIKSKEDWLMAVQIFKKASHTEFIDESLVVYRTHPGSKRQKPDYYHNVKKTFNYVMENEVEAEDKVEFFKKVNDYWTQIVDQKNNQIAKVHASTSFKLGNVLVKPFAKISRWIKN